MPARADPEPIGGLKKDKKGSPGSLIHKICLSSSPCSCRSRFASFLNPPACLSIIEGCIFMMILMVSVVIRFVATARLTEETAIPRSLGRQSAVPHTIRSTDETPPWHFPHTSSRRLFVFRFKRDASATTSATREAIPSLRKRNRGNTREREESYE